MKKDFVMTKRISLELDEFSRRNYGKKKREKCYM